MVKIFVGKLPKDVTCEELRELFDHFGEIDKCEKLENRPFGFVDMNDSDCANAAVTNLDKTIFHGSTIKVELSVIKCQNHKLFVGNISTRTTGQDLRELFSSVGAKVINAENCEGKKFGFVNIETQTGLREVQQLIRELNGYRLDGSEIIVDLSQDDKRKLQTQNNHGYEENNYRAGPSYPSYPQTGGWNQGYERGFGSFSASSYGSNCYGQSESLMGPVPDIGLYSNWMGTMKDARGQNRAGDEVKPEHEVYIGNYPVKFRDCDIRDLFEEYDIMVGDIRMKHDGWKA